MTCDVTYDSDGKQVGDAELFAGMKGAMKILNFSPQDQNELWKIVAIVMHLGNIVFKGNYAPPPTPSPMKILLLAIA